MRLRLIIVPAGSTTGVVAGIDVDVASIVLIGVFSGRITTESFGRTIVIGSFVF
jgi:hypothetical protein